MSDHSKDSLELQTIALEPLEPELHLGSERTGLLPSDTISSTGKV